MIILGSGCIAPLILNPIIRWGNGQPRVPADLPWGIGGWVGHRASLEVLEKESLPPAGIQTPRSSSQ